ncbi:MAG: Outer rane porin protein 32 [Burkholderiaceae bacterium]|nr:Outer rane porin protein 32 [Burkholderiaceae bacterium]
MKTQLLLAAVLSAFAGVASAATSVTMYGRADVGYEYKKVDNSATSSDITQEANGNAGNNRFGIRGNEDLGNGVSATFQLEGRFEGDTGSKSTNRTFFDRESTVGIKGAFGHVRLGRSYAAMDNALGFIDLGRRYSSYSAYNQNWGVATRHSNALFYNYSNSGFTVGADVTTKGGYNDGLKTVAGVDNTSFSNEGVAGSKAAYGVFAKYKNTNLEVGLGYQDDGVQTSKKIRREWGAGAAYTFAPITLGASYAQGKDDVVGGATSAKLQTISAFLSGKISANDQLYLVFRREGLKDTAAGGTVKSNDKITRYALGYVHNLSKRTSIYADVARESKKDKTGAVVAGSKFWGYDIALRHNF